MDIPKSPWKRGAIAILVLLMITFSGCTSSNGTGEQPEKVVSHYLPAGELTPEQKNSLWHNRITMTTGYAKERAELIYEHGVEVQSLISEMNRTCWVKDEEYREWCEGFVNEIYTSESYYVEGIMFGRMETGDDEASITVSYTTSSGFVTTTYLLKKEWGKWVIYDFEDENGAYDSDIYPIDEMEESLDYMVELLREIVDTQSTLEKKLKIKQEALDVEYDELFRNSGQYEGKTLHFTGKIIQVIEVGTDEYDYRVYVTKEEQTFGYTSWDDVVYLHSATLPPGFRLLEDDLIEFWGEGEGIYTYSAILGNQVSVPKIKTLLIELVETEDESGDAGTKQESNEITLEKFNQLQDGMSYEQVVGILEVEGTLSSSSEYMGFLTESYTWSESGASIIIMFQNDELVSKSQFGLK